jgi:hypothetical protein
MQAKSPIRQRPKESNGVALLGAKESEERRATSGMDEEDKRSVDDALKLVRRDYVELITIWNSIGLAAEKKQAESLLLHQEIEELFKVRRTICKSSTCTDILSLILCSEDSWTWPSSKRRWKGK